MIAKKPLAVSSDAYFFEKDKSDSVLVLGVGNYLMGDEGIGVRAIQDLDEKEIPDFLDLLDGGTGGFSLLNCFEAYRHIILVDATMDGRPAGSIRLIEPRFAADFPSALSVHDVGLKDMIEAVYLMEERPKLYLFTVSIEEIKPMCLDLSPDVERAIPELTRQIIQLADSIHAKIS